MLSERGDEQSWGSAWQDTGRVVAWCLAIAALLSAVSVVAELTSFSGVAISDRVVETALLSLFPVGLALAAAVALALTDARDRDARNRWSARGRGAVALVAALTVATSAYAIFVMLVGKSIGDAQFVANTGWAQRLGFAGAALASAVVGAAALSVVVGGRRSVESVAEWDGDANGLLPWRVVGPTIVCLLVAALAMVERAADTGSIGTIGDRVATASSRFDDFPIAFVAFAVVVLLAAGRRDEARNGKIDAVVTIAGTIGLLAVVAGAYAVWRVATRDPSGLSVGGLPGWWGRAGVISHALASGTVGVAALYLARRLRIAEPAALEVGSSDAPARVAPFRALAAWLAVAALCSAASDVSLIAAFRGPLAIGDVIAEFGPFILLTAGLALAAAIVSATTRPDPTERDATNLAVLVIVAVVGFAALATSLYTVVYVLVGHDSGSFSSLIAHSPVSQRRGYVTITVATEAGVSAPVGAPRGA
jgi:hypothetical protein